MKQKMDLNICIYFEKGLPKFGEIAKIKHLLFLHEKLPENFDFYLENCPQKFKKELTTFQIEVLKASFININTYEFLKVLKRLIRNIHEGLISQNLMKNFLLLVIKDQELEIYNQIDDYFDKKNIIYLGNCIPLYNFCSELILMK
ncbi:hypothetical protein M0811_12373 [Anaeramoeba ignava]|uniref:Uncharacterized protein n=1 Tax=Anaeramoeba ignava TaxID=1746090 RepID=A0A9Q0L9S0_ANAIG|nr:hypothetical protein M0811_12373 [Anaeramoeba ignava]